MNSGGDDDRWRIINPTAGLDTYTSFEGGITLSGAIVSVKFNIDANTGYPMIQTVFGPCLADGKNATYWECMLRCLTLTSSLVHFEEKTSSFFPMLEKGMRHGYSRHDDSQKELRVS